MSAAFARSTAVQVRQYGFAFVHGVHIREWAGRIGDLRDWPQFADSWNRLGPDLPLAELGRQRHRRHSTYLRTADARLQLLPHRPHYQSIRHNPLQGGLHRWFEPIDPAVGTGPSLRTLVELGSSFFAELSPANVAWLVEAHQFRIEAHPGRPGEPTPEGIHRDGVDWVLVVLIDRVNIESGTTTIHANDGTLLGEFTLSGAFDAAFVDDDRVMHGVTAVEPVDPKRPAFRDVLVVTYRDQTSETSLLAQD